MLKLRLTAIVVSLSGVGAVTFVALGFGATIAAAWPHHGFATCIEWWSLEATVALAVPGGIFTAIELLTLRLRLGASRSGFVAVTLACSFAGAALNRVMILDEYDLVGLEGQVRLRRLAGKIIHAGSLGSVVMARTSASSSGE
jgi:hypothetical protein